MANSFWTTVALLAAVVIGAIALPSATTEGPTENPGDPEDGQVSGPVEFDAPIVVEVDHDRRFTGLATGPADHPGTEEPDHGPVDPEIQTEMERHSQWINAVSDQADRQAPGSGGPAPTEGFPTGTFASLNGGLSVAYNTSYPAPPNVRAVVNAAVARWDSVLTTNPSGPVVIEVFWTGLDPSLLGYAGPDGMFLGGGLPGSALYPAPLANTLLGRDVNGAARPEIQVVLNSELASSGRWYIGNRGNPSGAQIDLHSVVLHEVGHGLGFLGSADVVSGQTQPSLGSPVFAYDTVATYNGAALASYRSPAGPLTSGNLFASVSDDVSFELYAPGNWLSGSSYSHFDESSYRAGQAGALMTPMLANGETSRTIDSATLGLLARVGWPVATDAATPAIVSTAVNGTSVTVAWTPNLQQTGVVPDSYTVEAWLDGTARQRAVNVSGAASTATLTALRPGRNYTIRVVPNGPGGAGSRAAAGVVIPAAPTGGGGGTGTPSYVRHRPLDGQISRLYQAYFLRQPDQGGFNHWLDVRARGVTLASVSEAFARSDEFQNRYGALSNAAFVDLVYNNVLQRPADASGRQYWLGQLAQGVTRGEVMTGFAESNEFITRTRTAAPTSSTRGKIERLYRAVFLRPPDAGGLAYWTGQADGGVSLTTIADSLTRSGEYQTRYGSVANGAFVSLVYSNVLGRAADPAGRSYWTGQLGTGLGRGSMMVQFSESAEFIKSTGTIP